MGHKMGFGKRDKMVGDVEFLKSESLKPVIVFDVLAYVERVGKSDVFPSAQLSFYVSVEKGEMEYGEWTGILRSKMILSG